MIALLYCCECNFAKYGMFLNISPFQISATCYWSSGRRNMWSDRHASLTRKVKLFREWRYSSNCHLRKPQLHFCSSVLCTGIWKHGINSASELRKRRGKGGISDLIVHQRFWYLSFGSEDGAELMLGTCLSKEVVNIAQLCFHQVSTKNYFHAFSFLPGTIVEKSIHKDFSVWLFSGMLTSLVL